MNPALPAQRPATGWALCIALAAVLLAGAVPAHAGLLSVTASGRTLQVLTAEGNRGFTEAIPHGSAVAEQWSPDGLALARVVTELTDFSYYASAEVMVRPGLNEAASASQSNIIDFDVGAGGAYFHLGFDGYFDALLPGHESQLFVSLEPAVLGSPAIAQFYSAAVEDFDGPLLFEGALNPGSYRLIFASAVRRAVDGGRLQDPPNTLDMTINLGLLLTPLDDDQPPAGVPEPATAALVLAALGLTRAGSRRMRESPAAPFNPTTPQPRHLIASPHLIAMIRSLPHPFGTCCAAPRRLLAVAWMAAILLTISPPSRAGLLNVVSAGHGVQVQSVTSGEETQTAHATAGATLLDLSSTGSDAARAQLAVDIGDAGLTLRADLSVDLGRNEAGGAKAEDSLIFDVGAAGLRYRITLDGSLSAIQPDFIALVGLRLDSLDPSGNLLAIVSSLDAFAGPQTFEGQLAEGRYQLGMSALIGRGDEDASRVIGPIDSDAKVELSLMLSDVAGHVPEPASAALVLVALGLARVKRRRPG